MIYTKDIIGDQWIVFLKAVNLGILLGGCYDFFKITKIVLGMGKKLCAIWDFICCLWSGFLLFAFLLNENFGILRLYIVVAALIGFSLWEFIFGKISSKCAKLLRKILKTVLKPFAALLAAIKGVAEKIAGKAKINLFNFAAKLKSLLKNSIDIVYNILCLNVSKAFSFCGGKAGKEPEKFESNGTQRTEEGPFSQNRSYRIRNLSSLFPDFDSDEHKRKTNRT